MRVRLLSLEFRIDSAGLGVSQHWLWVFGKGICVGETGGDRKSGYAWLKTGVAGNDLLQEMFFRWITNLTAPEISTEWNMCREGKRHIQSDKETEDLLKKLKVNSIKQ